MKKEKLFDVLSLLLILIVIISAFYFYQVLPERVITHWNFKGEADGWSSKNFAVWFMPILLLGMYLLFKALPRLDPKRRNYEKFSKVYKVFQLAIISFLAFVYFVMSFVNLGIDLSVGKLVSTTTALLFIIFGFYMKDIKPNWFVGIKTPWTLSSDIVWKKTHYYAGKIFIISGVLLFVTSYLPESLAIYSFIVILLLILSAIVYSYFVYRKQGNKLEEDNNINSLNAHKEGAVNVSGNTLDKNKNK